MNTCKIIIHTITGLKIHYCNAHKGVHNTSTIQLNTLYNSTLSLMGRHLPRMALEMARTRVKFSLPYISPKTWLLWQEEVVAMQDARWEKVA